MRTRGRYHEADPDELFDALGDEYVRKILAETSREPLSAKQLSDRCEMSVSTVYRRADAMTELGLLEERTHVDVDGHHHSEYAPAVDHLDVDIDDGALHVEVSPREDAADRLTRVWEEIRRD